jgi:hypothetical protein
VPKCLQVLKVCKTAGERQDYAFDLTAEFSKLWEADHPYAAAAVVRPSVGTGLEYVSSGGQSNGEIEPEWPTPAGETVEDGSITWTAQALSALGLKHHIVDCTWTAPDGITASDQVETDDPGLQEIRIWVSGGTVGESYVITALVETNLGALFECRLIVSIE